LFIIFKNNEEVVALKKLLFIALILCITSPGFADDTTFTNEDLIIYSDEYMMHKKPASQYENTRANKYSDEKDADNEHDDAGLKDRREGQPTNMTKERCEVLDFSSHKINYAVHNPDYGIRGTITKQTVTVRIKSNWDMPLWVENFYIAALLGNGTKQTKQLEPAPGDSLTSWIQPGTEYVGYVTLEGDVPIASVGCHVIK
jgi:hypothetical protein